MFPLPTTAKSLGLLVACESYHKPVSAWVPGDQGRLIDTPARDPKEDQEEPTMPDSALLPHKVISGGQTGADQAGLIAAACFGIATGGWMPKGFKTATGPDPHLAAKYGLREHDGDYAERTEANVRDSDGTIHLAASFNTLGEKCTQKWIRNHSKPHLEVDMNQPIPVADVVDWLRKHTIRVLNVAGNVEPKSKTAKASGITQFVVRYLSDVFRALGHQEKQNPEATQ